MYRSTFAHLNLDHDIPAGPIQPVQTTKPTEPKRRRRGTPRLRRRFALGLARLTPGASAAP